MDLTLAQSRLADRALGCVLRSALSNDATSNGGEGDQQKLDPSRGRAQRRDREANRQCDLRSSRRHLVGRELTALHPEYIPEPCKVPLLSRFSLSSGRWEPPREAAAGGGLWG